MKTPTDGGRHRQAPMILFIAMIVVGILLLARYVIFSRPTGAAVSRVSGNPPSWLIDAGIVLILSGGLGVFHFRKK